MSSSILSSSESPSRSLDAFSHEESDPLGRTSEEQGAHADSVDIARPPRCAATSAEVVLSGQVALDVLDEVKAAHFLLAFV